MNKYESSLIQICRQCKTKPQHCNRKQCTRYNCMKELVELHNQQLKVVEKLKEIGISKKVEIILQSLGIYKKGED